MLERSDDAFAFALKALRALGRATEGEKRDAYALGSSGDG
jgi:hypothetical protein